jgi:cytochrome c oxidase subunit 4
MAKALTARTYLLTWLALIVLAAISLGLSFLHLPAFDLSASLVIATVKAALVAWFFMHLAEQPFASRLVLLVSVLLFALLISLTALDVASRRTFPKGPRPGDQNAFYRR